MAYLDEGTTKKGGQDRNYFASLGVALGQFYRVRSKSESKDPDISISTPYRARRHKTSLN